MKIVLVLLLVLLAALSEVTVASLFPLRAAVPDLILAVLVGVFVYAGPRSAMVAVPAAAVAYGFASDRAPGLLLLGYLPLVPLALLATAVPMPVNRYVQTLVAATATGLWVRLVLAFGAVAQDAHVEVVVLVRDLLLMGLLLDVALVSLVYLPPRLIGWQPRSLVLERGGWQT